MATLTILKGRLGPSLHETFAQDVNPAPAFMREGWPATGQSIDDVSVERYFSKAWRD